jgi:hypothetical protein
MREEALQRAAQKVQELERELKSKQEMAEAKEKEVEIKAYEAETKRVELLMPFMTAAQLAVLTTQTSGQATTPEDLVSEYSARKSEELQAQQAIQPEQEPEGMPLQ